MNTDQEFGRIITEESKRTIVCRPEVHDEAYRVIYDPASV